MIKPQSLWAAFKTATDSKELGDICRKLGGQNVELSPGAQMTYGIISADNEWHTESIEAQREKDRRRQAELRAKRAEEAARQAAEEAARQAAEEASRNVGAAATVAPVALNVPPSVDGVAVDWAKVEVSDEAIFSCETDPILIACKLTGEYHNTAGRGYWRRWMREYPNGEGEGAFRQAVSEAMHEIRAGEGLGRNPPAVLNERLKKIFAPKGKKRAGVS